MRIHEHDSEESLQRPKSPRTDPRPPAEMLHAAAAGRSHVLDAASILRLQRTVGNGGVGALLEEQRSPVHNVVKSGGGSPLAPDIHAEVSARLGHDFSDVRVHTDSQADDSARSVNAHAYTATAILDPGEAKQRLQGFENAPEYWAELQWQQVGGDPNVMKAFLPEDHPQFKKIADAVSRGLAENPYESPVQEATRMELFRKERAELLLKSSRSKEDNDKVETLDRRLREGRPGVKPPRSRQVKVQSIEVIANKDLWLKYQAKLNSIRKELSLRSDRNPLKKVAFSGVRSQLLDQEGGHPAGETYLFHGTRPENLDKIVEGGFKPELSPNKNKIGTAPRYGPLGQGSYFADVMSKSMTYTRCPVCSDYDCRRHKDQVLQMLYTRVALGHPKKAHAFLQHGNLRADDVKKIKEDRHSVYSKGWKASKYNPFDAASGQNEYAVKQAEQVYPEFRLHYTVI